jgi:hypothetical protein
MLGVASSVDTWLAPTIALIVAVLGFAGIFLQNRRTHERVAQIEHAVNHVEEEPDADGDGHVTLGQLVKSIDAKVDQGFDANAGAHRGFEQVQHDQGERLVKIRADVDGLHTEFSGHLVAEHEERLEIAAELGEKVEAVHEEVKTVNGHTIAALAEKADAQHTEETIPKEDRTTHEQAAVDRLHDHS